MAKTLENEGIDAIHVSGGDHHQMIHQVSSMAIPVCHNTWAVELIKKEVKIPVIASGSITFPQYAEDIIASGKADFIGLGRPLWADPEWPNKAKEGRSEDIRPCIRCNEGCLERTFFRFRAITCAVNPVIGREGDLHIVPAERSKRVAIVGDGPAGMEAARVCKLRGHDITLYEKRKLGGALLEASVPDFKADIRHFINYLTTQMKKLEIKVVNREFKPTESVNYDTVIVACGAFPIVPDIPGIHKPFVVQATEVLDKGDCNGNDIIVIGGGLVGTETAIYLAQKGKNVTIVEMMDELMRDSATTDKLAYFDMMSKMNNIQVYLGWKVFEIGDNDVGIVNKTGTVKRLVADKMVLAVGFKPFTQHFTTK